jgi:hypothetical protein
MHYLAARHSPGFAPNDLFESQITAMTHKSLLPDTTIGTGTLDLAQAAAQSGPVVVQLHGKTGASAGNVRPPSAWTLWYPFERHMQLDLWDIHPGHQSTTCA